MADVLGILADVLGILADVLGILADVLGIVADVLGVVADVLGILPAAFWHGPRHPPGSRRGAFIEQVCGHDWGLAA